ncbi:MAG TPA: endonuclease/exonuclease/phosphatase family protein [Kiritimatiellia bacterium]|nr:endonuclease/exonuclease/phosphatase family protein [Kiritimatiellia bacterium]HPS06592.1 endonuclease/exonuclease/phosphatase family protein [Kiritimatiellia bacterium]
MNPSVFFRRFHGLIEAAAFLGALFTLAGLLGRYVWFFEIFTHFKPHLAFCFLAYAGFELAARRHRHAVASLLLVAVNALPVLLLSLPSETHAVPLAAAPARLRILQANILTSNTNSAALLALVTREDPDVVVLQEPDVWWLRQLAPLTNSHPVFATLPRDDNFGAAIYCKTNALAAEIFLLSDPEGAPSSLARIAVGGRTVTVVGTHTLAPYNGTMWRGRNAFSLELAQTLRKVEGPLVVTGDFNNTPWSAHFRAFLKASGLHDSAQGRGPQPTWPTATSPLVRIPLDHCFHSDGVRILDKRTGPDIGSDHLPLLLDIAF